MSILTYPDDIAAGTDGYDPPTIPKLMWDCAQWICYRLVVNPDGKLDEIPSDPDVTGRLGNIDKTDHAKWLAYQQAVAYAKAKTHLDGVGFILGNRDPFAVIDLDKCRNPDTGAIAEWARTIIQAFESYTEVSPSGTGVHIWVYGAVRGTTRPVVEGYKIEVYSQNRFVTVTGDQVPGTLGVIVNAQDVLDGWAGDTQYPARL